MRTKKGIRLTAALMGAGLMFLTSCASIPPTNYYVLGLTKAPENPVESQKLPYVLAIAPFESESPYIRKKIVWREDPNRLGYYSYEKWAALPAEMFAYRLYERANAANLFQGVRSGVASDEVNMILRGKILAFEEMNTPEGLFGRVKVDVELESRDGSVLWNGIVGRREPAAKEDVDAVVTALANATEAAITEILANVETSLRAGH